MNARSALTSGEVAKYCGVNIRTVLRWIERGELQAFKLPGKRGDNRIEIDAFVSFLKINNLPIPSSLQECRTDYLEKTGQVLTNSEQGPSDTFIKAESKNGIEKFNKSFESVQESLLRAVGIAENLVKYLKTIKESKQNVVDEIISQEKNHLDLDYIISDIDNLLQINMNSLSQFKEIVAKLKK